MDACGLIQQLNCCANVNNVIIISIFDRPTIVSGRKSAMDKLVNDGYTMNANSAGGHLRWSIRAMLLYATIPDRPATHSR